MSDTTGDTIRATIHADLSDGGYGEEHHLWANGARHPLHVHTHETRAQARTAAPHLDGVPDERLTHYAHVAELPADAVLRVHLLRDARSFVGAPLENAPEHAPGHVAIYIPPAKRGAAVHLTLDYTSTAKALLFHHPDLATTDVEIARIVREYIDSDEITNLITVTVVPVMVRKGPPRPTSGWAHLIPFTPPRNDKTKMDGKQTRYQVRPISEVTEVLGPILTRLLKYTKNDPRLKGKKWRVENGKSVSKMSSGPHPMTPMATLDAAGTDTWRPTLADDRKCHGLTTSIELVDAAQRKIKIKMKNYFIRYLGAYIRFFDAEDKAIDAPGWSPEGASMDVEVVKELGIQYIDCHYIGFLSPINNIFAIPIDDMPGELEVVAQFPEKAVKAEIYGSGLGHGSNDWPNTPVIGGILTGFINLGIPSYLLARKVAAVRTKMFYDSSEQLMKNSKLRQLLLKAGMAYFVGSAMEGRPNFHLLVGMSNLLFNEGATQLLVLVEEEMVEQEILEAIPFAGWVLTALEIATGLAQIAETITEVSTSPWNITNTVAASITSKVTVHPDPRHMAFPQAPSGTLATYTVRMLYKGNKGDTRPTSIWELTVPGSTPNELHAHFDNNTLGGKVRFEVDYHIDGWLAGSATSGWIANDEPHATEVHLYLVEIPKPLDETSVYVHTAITIYDGGNYSWQQNSIAPTATATNSRNNSPQGNAISNWYGITLSQRHAMLGFAWRAAGMGIRSIVDGATGQLAAMQNIDIPGRDMVSVKFPTAGFDKITQLMYDPYPAKFQMVDGSWVLGPDNRPLPDPSDVRLGDYYLDPRAGENPISKGGGFHLRRVTLDASTPFNLDGSAGSYRRFEFPADSFAMHPAGFVIAVSSENKKIQILPIADEPSSDVEATLGLTCAGEALNSDRHGLLFKPVGVTCSYDGTIFVLEDLWGVSSAGESARIQAFDLIGNPVPCFKGADGTLSPIVAIGDSSTHVLDLIAVGNETMTYIYVLSYQGDGVYASDYQMSIYTRGTKAKPQQPLVTTPGFAAAKIAVDMWHTLYALNYAMTTNAAGVRSGPPGAETGPAGRTVPSISEWLPPILKK